MKTTVSAQFPHPLVASDWKPWDFVYMVNTSYFWSAEMPAGRGFGRGWRWPVKPTTSWQPAPLFPVECQSCWAEPDVFAPAVHPIFWELCIKLFLKDMILLLVGKLPNQHLNDSRPLLSRSHWSITVLLNFFLLFNCFVKQAKKSERIYLWHCFGSSLWLKVWTESGGETIDRLVDWQWINCQQFW